MTCLERAYKDPPGAWRPFPDDQPFKIAGLFFRKRGAVNFIRNALRCEQAGLDWGIDSIRDPDNEHDPNAVEMRGWWAVDGMLGPRRNGERLGYWPKDRAAALARDYPNADIAARPAKLLLSEDGEVDIEIVGLIGTRSA